MSTLTLRGTAATGEGIALPRLGRYELLRHLATGGMAELYLARAKGIEGFEKLVAVKRIRPDLLSNRDMVTLFLDEARLAATLHHPNIVQVFDVGVEERNYFFSMEFVHGQDVRALLAAASASDSSLALGDALTIAIALCSGLHYAHEKRSSDGKPLHIVHRDISPSNVIVSYDGAVKVLDFGIAKAASRTTETTTGGGVRGKLSYMSPEQCQHHTLDRRSDIFAIGILLYELTTCQRLFIAQSDYEVMKQIIELPIPPPSTKVANYPPALEAIVMRALARNPKDRFATAEEVQLALETFTRVTQQTVSTVGLARTMSRLFRENIDAFHQAQREGRLYVEPVVSVGDPSIEVVMGAERREGVDAETVAASPSASDVVHMDLFTGAGWRKFLRKARRAYVPQLKRRRGYLVLGAALAVLASVGWTWMRPGQPSGQMAPAMPIAPVGPAPLPPAPAVGAPEAAPLPVFSNEVAAGNRSTKENTPLKRRRRTRRVADNDTPLTRAAKEEPAEAPRPRAAPSPSPSRDTWSSEGALPPP